MVVGPANGSFKFELISDLPNFVSLELKELAFSAVRARLLEPVKSDIFVVFRPKVKAPMPDKPVPVEPCKAS